MRRSLWPEILESPVGTKEAPLIAGFPIALAEQIWTAVVVHMSYCHREFLVDLLFGTSARSRCLAGERSLASQLCLQTLAHPRWVRRPRMTLDLENMSTLSPWAIVAAPGHFPRVGEVRNLGQCCLEPSAGQVPPGAWGRA